MDVLDRPNVDTGATWVGKVGLAARGALYILIGLLALVLAVRHHGAHADQKGAVTDLASQPFGAVLVVLIAIGLAAYAAWQAFQVFAGPAGEKDETSKRLRCAASFLAYAALTVSAITILAGARGSSGSQQQGFTAKVMGHTGGRTLVGIVGVVVVVGGLALAATGFKATFMKRMRDLSGSSETVVRRLGQVGTIARGVVFALAGVLVVDAAVTFDPKKAEGIDGVFRTLLRQPFGPWLTALAALGLLAFGLFGLCEARYRRT